MIGAPEVILSTAEENIDSKARVKFVFKNLETGRFSRVCDRWIYYNHEDSLVFRNWVYNKADTGYYLGETMEKQYKCKTWNFRGEKMKFVELPGTTSKFGFRELLG